MAQLTIDRRSFLKIAAAAGLAAGTAPLVASRRPASAQSDAATDPLEALASSLDYDAERIFRFVADQVRYEPYSGVLRGPAGTLSAMAGNSADQALLLARLLEASLGDYRFVQGAIDDGIADAIMDRATLEADALRAAVLDATAGRGEDRQPVPGPSPDAETGRLLQAAREDGPAVVDWARDRILGTARTIEQVLRDGGVGLPAGFTPMPSSERERHTWLQLRSGADWIDLDATLPGPTVGTAATTPSATLDALPDDQHHRVAVTVVVEQVQGDALVEQDLLRVEWPAHEIGVRPLVFANIHPDGFKGTGVGIGDLLQGTTTYLPMLTYGDSATVGDQLRFQTGPDVFGTTPTGATEGEATAEWLEVTTTAPDAPPVTVRREVFDRIGAAARATGAFDPVALPPVQLAEAPGGIQDYLPALTVHWLTVHNGPLGGEALRRAVAVSEDADGLATIVSGYHVLRESAGLEVAVPAGVHAIVDAPNVVGMTARPVATDDGTFAMETGIDIWQRSFARLPVRDVAASVNPAILAGVTSHVAERILLGEGSPRRAADAPPSISVGSLFEAAGAQGIGLRLVRAPRDVAGLDYPGDASIRLTRAIEDGWIAVAPERAVELGGRPRAGWWLIDTRSGRVLDELDDGRGTAGLEHEHIMIQTIIKTHPAWLILRVCLIGVAIIAAAMIGLAATNATGGSGVAMGLFGGAGASAAFPTALYCASA